MDWAEAPHVGWHHHRLLLWVWVYSAGGGCIFDPGLAAPSAGHLCSWLPLHLLHLVGRTRKRKLITNQLIPLKILEIVSRDLVLAPLFFNRVLPKSARWLMANQKNEEALDLIRKAALVNGNPLRDDIELQQVGQMLAVYIV